MRSLYSSPPPFGSRGAMRPVLVLVLIETREVGSRNAGSAGGLFFSVAEIGGFLGPLTVGYLFDASGDFSAGLHLLTATCVLLVLLLARFWQITR
jgi:CP family cyanate transporter-like MFS transporter